jgi:circadian clock protein KaiC
VVIDPITQLRYLTPDAYQFRKEVTGLIRFFEEREATVLFTSQASDEAPDDDLQFISHGVIDLQHHDTGRSVRVPKFRGSDIQGGWHGFRITERGLQVFPKLVPEDHTREFEADTISSGIPEIDELLNGGIERGTVTILSGPSGVGKTSLGAQFMKEAAGRGVRSAIYSFEESRQTLLHRSESLAIPVEAMLERDTLTIEEFGTRDRSVDESIADEIDGAGYRRDSTDGCAKVALGGNFGSEVDGSRGRSRRSDRRPVLDEHVDRALVRVVDA